MQYNLSVDTVNKPTNNKHMFVIGCILWCIIILLMLVFRVVTPWRWRQYVPPKRCHLPTSPHGVTTTRPTSTYSPPWEPQVSYIIMLFYMQVHSENKFWRPNYSSLILPAWIVRLWKNLQSRKKRLQQWKATHRTLYESKTAKARFSN
jgi:hypothetical protein